MGARTEHSQTYGSRMMSEVEKMHSALVQHDRREQRSQPAAHIGGKYRRRNRASVKRLMPPTCRQHGASDGLPIKDAAAAAPSTKSAR